MVRVQCQDLVHVQVMEKYVDDHMTQQEWDKVIILGQSGLSKPFSIFSMQGELMFLMPCNISLTRVAF